MSDLGKIRVVVEREFLSTVKRRSYLIVTFGMPVFVSLYLGLVAFLPAMMMAKSGASKKDVGLVDESGVVRPEEMAHLDRGTDREMRELTEKLGKLSSRGKMAASLLEN